MHILILSANTGEGHNSAAQALKEHFEAQGSRCSIIDGLSFLPGIKSAVICKGHVFFYRRLPKFYGMGYRMKERQAKRRGYQEELLRKDRQSCPLNRRITELRDILNSGEYDAVVCVHVFAARLVSELRIAGQIRIPAYFLATDYTCSPGVNQLDMDAWFIPHRKLIPEFMEYGIPAEKIFPTGLPIRRVFMAMGDKTEARKKLSLPADRRIAVLSCGSMGAGPMGKMVLALVEALPKDALLVVICGSNRALERSLKRLIRSKKLRVVGFTRHMHDYMDAADLFITKPGGLSTTEAVYKRIPLILINAVPGCETRNMEMMKALGCAISVSGPFSLARTVKLILRSGESLDTLKQSCMREFTQDAAEEIHRVLLEKVSSEKNR